jgi:hypothetical protein
MKPDTATIELAISTGNSTLEKMHQITGWSNCRIHAAIAQLMADSKIFMVSAIDPNTNRFGPAVYIPAANVHLFTKG